MSSYREAAETENSASVTRASVCVCVCVCVCMRVCNAARNRDVPQEITAWMHLELFRLS